MKRRAFLALTGAAALGPAPARAVHAVRGPIDAASMGTTLVHEHVLVDFAGAEVASRSRYDAEAVFHVALPQLQELRSRGCQTFFECTPAYLGRDPLLLRRLSEASGLQVVTNTGYYGAARDIAIPKHAYAETPKRLAARWTAEFEGGIEGTGIRPGFVKLGVDTGPLSPIDRKLVEAGALTPPRHGPHAGDPHGRRARGPRDHAACSRGSGSHRRPTSGCTPRTRRTRRPARGPRCRGRGSSSTASRRQVSRPTSVPCSISTAGTCLGRVLVSQDAGWYHVGEPGGGSYRPHTFLFDAFVPALRAGGLGDAEIRTLLVTNPAEAFAIRRRVTQPS